MRTTATDDIIAMCEQLRSAIDVVRVGKIEIRIQDGRLLTFVLSREYRRNYEIRVADLALDKSTTVMYNVGDISVDTG